MLLLITIKGEGGCPDASIMASPLALLAPLGFEAFQPNIQVGEPSSEHFAAHPKSSTPVGGDASSDVQPSTSVGPHGRTFINARSWDVIREVHDPGGSPRAKRVCSSQSQERN
ncbi:hypothetical protein AMTR_s00075p00192610 [Amborella trichopoda]|uniref:Uncharacterized protein n=1 Tax=Amborella trichopoda TaxID=13333 RepID=W1PAB3_AMBTC|nr:hypothetical protein AMTR_s00075p00192610 [Amborella trichopoda]